MFYNNFTSNHLKIFYIPLGQNLCRFLGLLCNTFPRPYAMLYRTLDRVAQWGVNIFCLGRKVVNAFFPICSPNAFLGCRQDTFAMLDRINKGGPTIFSLLTNPGLGRATSLPCGNQAYYFPPTPPSSQPKFSPVFWQLFLLPTHAFFCVAASQPNLFRQPQLAFSSSYGPI